MIREFCEFNVECSIFCCYSIGIIPLTKFSSVSGINYIYMTDLKILRRAIPNINSLEEWIITTIKRTAIGIKLVRENQNLFRAIVCFPRHGAFRGVGIDKARAHILQQRLIFLS